MTPEQLDNLTPREYENKLTGFEQLEEKREQAQWEQFRLLASTLLTPHTKKGKGIKPKKLWVFPWDKKENQPSDKMSKERLEYITKRSKLLKDG